MTTPLANSTAATFVPGSSLSDVSRTLSGNAKWGGVAGTGVTLSFSFPTSSAAFKPAYGEGEPQGLRALDADEKAAVVQALNIWANGANVHFTQVADSTASVGELRFAASHAIDADAELAHAYLPFNGPEAGDVWFSDSWHVTPGPIAPGSDDFHTILHEIGHTLGLKHPFAGSPTGPDDLSYSIMSYAVHAGAAGDVTASIYPTTPMFADLLTLQHLYGPTSVNAGDTIYTYYGDRPYWEAITDSGGTDTIAYVSATGGVIDLGIGRFSQLGLPIQFSDATSSLNTVVVGPSAAIENALGGDGDDTIYGNALRNRLDGGAGSDSITGGGGFDTLVGGEGADRLSAGSGSNADLLLGGPGDDALSGAGGTVVGGAGNDILDFGVASYVDDGAVAVSLLLPGTPQDTGGAGTDTLYYGIGALIGSAFADSLTGNEKANVLSGGGGNDTISAGAGLDRINGGAGDDVLDGGADGAVASYVSDAAVTVSLLLSGPQNTGGAGTDTLSNIYGLDGGDGNDTFVGSSSYSQLRGGGGNDSLTAGAASDYLSGDIGDDTLTGGLGDDDLWGGAGNDTASYVGATAVNVSLLLSYQVTGAGTDSIVDIENLTGGDGNDRLTGNAAANSLYGGAGNDTIVGGGGRDLITGAGGLDVMKLNALSDSGTVFATRDVTNTFAHGDKIDLSSIDASSRVAGNQAFTFVTNFTRVAGQLQWDQTAPAGWLVTGDVNGDGVADFSLQIYASTAFGHPYAWDFIL
jgi:Ca2+-binding RTX toxin-like protein